MHNKNLYSTQLQVVATVKVAQSLNKRQAHWLLLMIDKQKQKAIIT